MKINTVYRKSIYGNLNYIALYLRITLIDNLHINQIT